MDESFQYKGCRVRLPEVEDSILEFKRIDKQMMAPFTIYADCEAIIKNVNDKDIHEISGFTIADVSPYEKTEKIAPSWGTVLRLRDYYTTPHPLHTTPHHTAP